MAKVQKTKVIKRGLGRDSRKLYVKYKGKNFLISYKFLMDKFGVAGIIRFHKKDYDELSNMDKLAHFNFQKCNHIEGKKYLLMEILEPGFFTDDFEKQPLLNLDEFHIGKCYEVREFQDYADLTDDDIALSFKHMDSIFKIKKEIILRYSKSLPNIKKTSIPDYGVSVTKLKNIKKFDMPLGKIDFFQKNYSKLLKEMDSIDFSKKCSVRTGFGKGAIELGKDNSKYVFLCADLKDSLKLGDFSKKYPKRFFEMGISEQNMMGVASGMTINNKVPFVCSYSAFNPGRNWDQLRVSVCYSNTNVKIVGSHAGLSTGPDGATHQALEDIAITRVLPNITVMSPCDEEEARKMTILSAKHQGPVYIRLFREKSMCITQKKDKFQVGKANIIYDGSDIVIFAHGITVQFAIEARKKLLDYGIDCAIINMHTIKPLDEKTVLKYAQICDLIVSIEDHQIIGGLGSAISEFLSQTYPKKIEMIGANDTFGESGDGYELLQKYNISSDEIVKRVLKYYGV